MHPVSLFVPRARHRTPPPSHPQPVDAAPFDMVLASGDGLLDVGRHAAVAWCVLRGRVLVQSREGAFELGPRDWIALDRDSSPTAWLGAGSVVFGVGIDPAMQRALQAATDQPVLFPGRGRMPPRARALERGRPAPCHTRCAEQAICPKQAVESASVLSWANRLFSAN